MNEMCEDTARLDWLAENKASVNFSNFIVQVCVPNGPRAATYHQPPLKWEPLRLNRDRWRYDGR